MKQLSFALLAGAAAGFSVSEQLSLFESSPRDDSRPYHDATQAWWDSVPNTDSMLSSFEENMAAAIDSDYTGPIDSSIDLHPGHGGHHGDVTKTIYELIKESKYTQKFSELVDEFDEIKALLEDTEKQNRTLLVPTDSAWERLPDGHKPPPKEFVLAVLKYHIVPGRYPLGRVLHSHTLPTELDLPNLGGHSQRLRFRIGLFGARINFFSKVIAADVFAKNGVIHALDSILVPPPPTKKVIQLLPNTFSTFRLAMETTGLGEELDSDETEHNGGTLFAPTNRAFARLGPRANAFLFSDYGKKYLKALLKYHVVANETLYSDEFYKGPHHDDDGGGEPLSEETYIFPPLKETHSVDLPSLLDEKPIRVTISRWRGFYSMRVNGRVHVAIQDGLAGDGVIQVVGNVLIPPHKHHKHHDHDEEFDVEDEEGVAERLKARLEPYLETERGSKSSSGLSLGDL
ncbi:fasciclin domain family [Apodospora peruviana]|uniref:Fasciclin domain family n=1 Tax=Apodospora peruviana TaxID=516989 RepID=A0AAE0MH78_9PEZI|nr:fasciclin domain family [Apodospora peruviana]